LPDSDNKRIKLDRENNEQTRRLKRSLNKVRWSHALMQIFWTAGPVTTLGLIGGYYIGYGTMPPLQLLIYFVSFTVFSGIIGLIAKVVYDGTRGHLNDQSERDILTVTDKLADLILVARDKVVEAYEGEARQREAALQLLRRIDQTPYGVTLAFTDLTGEPEIGQIMGRIFTYRRIGIQTKVRELYVEHNDQIQAAVKKLKKKSPQAAKELKDWFTGNTSGSLKYGVRREKHFLQRVMSAIENDNPYIMTFRDVEEMMILAFELINGREIPTLIFNYPGKWRYASALDEMEKKRSQYRVAQARGGNRIRALAAYLTESGFASAEELPEGLEINELIKKVTAKLDSLLKSSDKSGKKRLSILPKEARHFAVVMENCLELYKMAFDGYKESAKRHKELVKASEKWQKILSESDKSPGSVKVGAGRRGIRINESIISLNEEERLRVCRHLIWYFDKEDIKGGSRKLIHSFSNQGGMSARRLAIEIAVALEPHIKLSKPEIQRNINATKAVYLGGLSPDMSAVQKQDLGAKMAREADNRMDVAAIRLAETLVHQYHVDLSEEAVEFLHFNYNAGLKSLNRVINREKEDLLSIKSSNDVPPAIHEPKPEWKRSLQEIKKTAARLS